MKTLKLYPVFLLSLIIASCVSYQTEVNEILDSWTGAQKSDVIDAYGSKFEVKNENDGKELYIYSLQKIMEAYPAVRDRQDDVVYQQVTGSRIKKKDKYISAKHECKVSFEFEKDIVIASRVVSGDSDDCYSLLRINKKK